MVALCLYAHIQHIFSFSFLLQSFWIFSVFFFSLQNIRKTSSSYYIYFLIFCCFVATGGNYELKTFLSRTLIKVWHSRNMVVYICIWVFLFKKQVFLYVDCQDTNIRWKRSFAHMILIINEIVWISKRKHTNCCKKLSMCWMFFTLHKLQIASCRYVNRT